MYTAATSLVFDEYPSYKGGSTLYDRLYIWEFCPDHHLRNKWGWVPQAWLVAEDKLGRPLYRDPNPHKSDCVHHIDEVKTNNHPDNLEVMTRGQHWQFHARRNGEVSKTPLDRDRVEDAMRQTGSAYKAAKLLGCGHQTLHNRFYDVIKPYLRESPFVDYDNPELISKVLVWANNRNMKVSDIQWERPLSVDVVRKLCRRHNIECLRRRRTEDKQRSHYRGQPTTKDPEMIQAVRDMLDGGQSVEQIAELFGKLPITIKTMCRKHGISYPLKKADRTFYRPCRKIHMRKGRATLGSPQVVELIRKKLSAGVPVENIAELLGSRPQTIRLVCRRNGIPYPRRGRRWGKNPYDGTTIHESSERRVS